MMDTQWAPFVRRVLIATGIVAGVGVLLYLVATYAEAFFLVFGGILLAILFRALSGFIERFTPLPGNWALALLLLMLAGVIAIGSWLGAPYVMQQFQQLVSDLPEYIEKFQHRVKEFVGMEQLAEQIPDREDLAENKDSMIGGITTAFSTTFNFFFDIIIIMILGVYFAVAPRLYTNGFLRLIPANRRERLGEVLEEVGGRLRWWLLGQLITMILVGILTAVGLKWLGVSNAVALGIMAGLLTFVPYLGPILAFVPIALIAIPSGLKTFLFVLLLYVAIQSLEGYVLTPLIQQRAVLLPPALILIAQLMAGVLVGPIGVVFATPLAAATLVLIRRLYVEDVVEAVQPNMGPGMTAFERRQGA